ncbi:MAG TPA: hypothetical protein VF006_22025 [Longimicrobium sp.]
MKGKLTLDLDDLSVDSFDTTTPPRAKGTVFGEQCTCWTQCGQNTCPGCPTCDSTCNGANTCAASCAYTCAYTCDDASCAGCSGAATCAYSCNYTDCDCVPPTCQQTNCGMELCCPIQ